MNSLLQFIQGFLKNKGQFVFASLLIAKVCAFLGSLLIIRILPVSEFGLIGIVASVFAIFAPFSGFGSTQSLLRFGSIVQDRQSKKELTQYLFRKGFFGQVVLSLIFLGSSFYYLQKYQDIFLVFLSFSIRLVGVFFISHIQSELRINQKNRIFARMNNVVNSSSLVMILVFSYFFGMKGYLLAMSLGPFVSLFWLNDWNFKGSIGNLKLTTKEIRNYALHSAGTASFSDALFSIDILLIAYFLDETAVANYKVAILIPTNITFLALSFMQTDFPTIAQNSTNKSYLKNYIVNYYKLFVPISVVIFAVGSYWSAEILHLIFGVKYFGNTFIFCLLLGAFCVNMLFRNLYGNLNSAVGKMKFNTIVSVLALIILIGLSFILVPKYGLNGMAVSVCCTLFLSGIILAFYFHKYLKNLK